MYHLLRYHMPLGFMICSMQVYFGHVQESFQALAFCALTGPRCQRFPPQLLFPLILSVQQVPVSLPSCMGVYWLGSSDLPARESSLHLGAGCEQRKLLDVSQAPNLHFATQLLILLMNWQADLAIGHEILYIIRRRPLSEQLYQAILWFPGVVQSPS